MNETISYSELRGNLKTYLDKICSDNNPLLVKRRNGEDLVIVSRQDFEALEETAYLMRSKKNAKRLIESLERKKSERIKFNSLKDMKDEIGV